MEAELYPQLRCLREQKNLTQRDLALVLNCTQACYCHYEKGKRSIPASTLAALASYYGVSVDYLMDRTNVTTPYPK